MSTYRCDVCSTDLVADDTNIRTAEKAGAVFMAVCKKCSDVGARVLVKTKGTVEESQANARLIAAAPDLLAALEALMGIVSDSHGVSGYHRNGDIAEWDEFDEINIAIAALAKAKGE